MMDSTYAGDYEVSQLNRDQAQRIKVLDEINTMEKLEAENARLTEELAETKRRLEPLERAAIAISQRCEYRRKDIDRLSGSFIVGEELQAGLFIFIAFAEMANLAAALSKEPADDKQP